MSDQTEYKDPKISDLNMCIINDKKATLITDQLSFNDLLRKTLTREEVKNIVSQVLQFNTEVVDYQLHPYSDKKLGFLGSHLRLVVVAKEIGCTECKKYSFFVKTIPYHVPTQSTFIKEKRVFDKEVGFFQHFVPLMIQNFKGDDWLPKCYFIKKDTIVLENMKCRGFSSRDKFFDERTARAAVACIARFHASSLLAEERLNGKPLNELCPEILQESEFIQSGRNYLWYMTAMDFAVSLAKDLGRDSSQILRAGERLFDISKISMNKRNVIAHGDLWSNNIIFDRDDHCCLLDFQAIRYGPLGQDLMQLLYLTTTKEFREKYEQCMLEYYYMNLKKCLVENEYKGNVPCFEEVLQGAEEQRVPALITATLFFPTVLMDSEYASKIFDNSDTYEIYYFVDRKRFVDKIMSKDPLYRQRLKNLVNELVDVSLKLDSFPRPT